MATIFWNNEYLKEEKIKIKFDSEAFLYGFSLLETMRAYRGKIIYLDMHLERIINSARKLNLKINYNKDKIKKIILATLKLNNYNSCKVRLILAKEGNATNLLVTTEKYLPLSEKYRTGFSVCVSKFRQFSRNFLNQFKSANYLFYLLAYKEAKRRGFDEAIILNEKEEISEASRANIFWVKNDILFTPKLECGCLAGITRRVVFDLSKRLKLKVKEVKSQLEDLLSSQEAFLTNSLMGIMPLVKVDGKLIGEGRLGKITKRLSKEYNKLYD